MNKTELINQFITGTIKRAENESLAWLVIVLSSGFFLQIAPVGSSRQYGALICIIAGAFSVGVLWSNALSHDQLDVHPATDVEYWRKTFLAQARLLRLAPLWNLAPACAGALLVFAPTRSGQFVGFAGSVISIAMVFIGHTQTRRDTAAKIEADAQTFSN